MLNKKINTIEDIFKSETKDRGLVLNIIICIVSFLIFYFAPSIFYAISYVICKNQMISEIIGRIMAIILIGLFYYKDLQKEFRELKNHIGTKIGVAFKYYGIGIAVMMISNLILLIVFKDISTNETQVRQLLMENPLPMMFTISILAPLIEELTFRKSIKDAINSKWIYVLISGLVFGGLHVISSINSPIDLIYLVPYCSLGFIFALLYYKTNNIFSTITAHSFHNTLALILYLIG